MKLLKICFDLLCVKEIKRNNIVSRKVVTFRNIFDVVPVVFDEDE